MINLESLHCFVAAAQLLNFRAAAKQVALSPAAFTDRIQKLEDDLDAKLFIRTTRQVRLSPQGEALLPQAMRTLAEAQKCHTSIYRKTDLHLRLGTRYELGNSYVLPALEKLNTQYPHWKIHLVFRDSHSLFNGIQKGEIDAMITSARFTNNKVQSLPLHEERYCFVGAPGLLEKTPLNEKAQAQNHVLVDIAPALPLFQYLLHKDIRQQQWKFKENRYMGTISAMRYWISRGMGVGVLPEYYIHQQLQNKTLIQIVPDIPLRTDWFRLIWMKNHPREDVLQQLGSILQEEELR